MTTEKIKSQRLFFLELLHHDLQTLLLHMPCKEEEREFVKRLAIICQGFISQVKLITLSCTTDRVVNTSDTIMYRPVVVVALLPIAELIIAIHRNRIISKPIIFVVTPTQEAMIALVKGIPLTLISLLSVDRRV